MCVPLQWLHGLLIINVHLPKFTNGKLQVEIHIGLFHAGPVNCAEFESFEGCGRAM